MLKQRILTALVLLPLMVGMLFYAGTAVWTAFCGLIAMVALWEYTRMSCLKPWQTALYLAVSLAGGVWISLAGIKAPLWLHALALVFWLVVAPLWLKYKWRLTSPAASVLVGWLLMVPFWWALVSLRPNVQAAGYLLAVMALVWIADIAAYFVGKSIGKHKLAPNVSPNKSWEGAVGGAVCVCIYAWILQQNPWFAEHLGWHLSWWQMEIAAVLLTAVSIGGDLMESWLKRAAGVKDSSQLLPGHGGVFDRVDAMISVLSVYAALAAFAG